jgi:sugar lactone lactonase YvrE
MRPFRMFLLIFFPVLVFTLSAGAQQDQINTVVGGSGPNDIPAIDADLYGPYQVALDSHGNYYFASRNRHQVFKVDSTGFLTVVAGNGLQGYSGDGVFGGAAQAMLNTPFGVTVDSLGNVYIADTYNQVIRKVDTTNTITTVAGVVGNAGYNGDGSPATSFWLYYPSQLAVDSSNNVFIADANNARIRKLTVSSGTISTVAGNGGSYAYCANGTLATSCDLSYTLSVAVDSADDIFLEDVNECVVYEVNHGTGNITTIAGTAGTCGGTGDGGAATSAEINPLGYGELAVNSAGTQVWLADYWNDAIRLIAVGGHINTVAGQNGTCNGTSGDGGAATSACVGYPIGIAVDSAGDLFLTNGFNGVTVGVREVPCSLGGACTPPTGDTAGNIYTVAGNGSTSDESPVNGVPALNVTLYYPAGVLVDPSGNIFISDTANQVVRELVNSSGDVNIFAGKGTAGYGSDGVPATSAYVNYPAGIARDYNGNIFFADTDNCIIREVNTSSNISTFAGIPLSCAYGGDGGLPTGAHLNHPNDVFLDTYGNMFIADTSNQVIREIVCATTGTLTCIPPTGETGGYIYTVAGNNHQGYGGDGGPATSAELYAPFSAAVDGAGNLYVADTDNHRIREVNAVTKVIDTVAGNGTGGFSGDGPATANSLYYPEAVRAGANGNIFIADTNNNRIRWVDAAGTMTTFAGTGGGSGGDGGPAIDAGLYLPAALFEDTSGNFFIADTYNDRIRKINAFAAVGRSASSLLFEIQPVGTISDALDLILSGIGPASITNVSTSGDFTELDNCVGSLPNGTTCTVSVYFMPTHSGARYGTLTVTTNGYLNTTTTVALQGTGEGLTITGAPLSFGSHVIGTPTAKSVTIKGSTTYSSLALSGDTTDFTITNNTCTGTISSCTISVNFNPQSAGLKKATLVIKDSDPTSPQLVAATGSGTSYESLTPASVKFANTLINATSANTKITFKYTGTGTLTLSGITPSANFSVDETGITTDPCSNGLMLTQNKFCYFNVACSPGTTLGQITGNVTVSFTGDIHNSSLVLPLSGNGTEVKITGSLAFGTVTGGTSKPLSVTVTNEGTVPLTFSPAPSMSGTDAAQYVVLPYSVSPLYSTCLNGSVTLTQTQHCTITVQFNSPAGSAGSANPATLNIYDNGGGSPQTSAASGKD